ncbi:MAG: Rieske (2Fe-2S) protein [Kineosporiaceae bacterium]|nr:Rieske (2Fe-2S) protein [Kineosporiaceae bacterium]
MSTSQPGQAPTPTRRSVLTAGAGAVAGLGAVGALAACGSDDVAATASSAAGAAGSAAASAAAGAASGAASAAAGAAGAAVAKLTDIPVGGAVVKEIAGQKVVFVQPEAGKVVAFDARCPHQGCIVAPEGAKLKCPCHASTFDAATGAVEQGPATTGLKSLSATVSGDGITLG